ncbi:MAG: hypothetical protein S4CHLAM6_04440 [Chlamydiae bacterium]|nr:hypothetical protein [Chlamydiota bacterium]
MSKKGYKLSWIALIDCDEDGSYEHKTIEQEALLIHAL